MRPFLLFSLGLLIRDYIRLSEEDWHKTSIGEQIAVSALIPRLSYRYIQKSSVSYHKQVAEAALDNSYVVGPIMDKAWKISTGFNVELALNTLGCLNIVSLLLSWI